MLEGCVNMAPESSHHDREIAMHRSTLQPELFVARPAWCWLLPLSEELIKAYGDHTVLP